MTTNNRGFSLSSEEINHRVTNWLDSDEVSVRGPANQPFMCGWWDHRDALILYKIAAKRGKIEMKLSTGDQLKDIAGLLKRVLGAGRPPVVTKLGIRECANTEEGDDGVQGKEDDENEETEERKEEME